MLSRVGAFVEGPGFLPHLTGRRTCALYWQATGRPPRRRTSTRRSRSPASAPTCTAGSRTYSQGMRQRLAIAQAMLGLPDLLVLDEPTNGLDPPQIREMREVLERYAATGRTVVVSSHLLSEVEQTCTHVVVMPRGRLVAQGPVAELVGTASALLSTSTTPTRAAAGRGARARRAGLRRADAASPCAWSAPPAPSWSRALVAAGVAVDRLAPQRGLEEAFLALVGEG